MPPALNVDQRIEAGFNPDYNSRLACGVELGARGYIICMESDSDAIINHSDIARLLVVNS